MRGYIDLTPGVALQISPEPGPVGVAYEATVRTVSDTGITLTVPRRGDERLPLVPGMHVTVFAAFNGQLYRFSCKVKLVEQFPQEAVVLAPPDEAVNAERRGFFRLFTRVVPRYTARVDHKLVELQPLSAVIMDISGGGLLIQTREWVPTGSRVRLVFALDDDPVEFDLLVIALSVLRPGRSQSYRIHCRFIDVATADVERIVRHVFRQQVYLRRKGAL